MFSFMQLRFCSDSWVKCLIFPWKIIIQKFQFNNKRIYNEQFLVELHHTALALKYFFVPKESFFDCFPLLENCDKKKLTRKIDYTKVYFSCTFLSAIKRSQSFSFLFFLLLWFIRKCWKKYRIFQFSVYFFWSTNYFKIENFLKLC